MKNRVIFEDLGQMPYQEAWDYQTALHNRLIEHKRTQPGVPPVHHLLFVEHPPVFTLGKSGSMENLLVDEQKREEEGIGFFRINRGGDITYHGPGQIVAYPIFDLDYFRTDVRWFVYTLEESVIRTLSDYGLSGKRIEGFTGVWMETGPWETDRKICAIGVHLSRWVSLHGIAFNVNTGLDYYDMIVPCGISAQEKTVTSLSRELGVEMDMEEVKERLKYHFARQFDLEFIEE